ncbi:unnamed protein product [Urochloa humidicola]
MAKFMLCLLPPPNKIIGREQPCSDTIVTFSATMGSCPLQTLSVHQQLVQDILILVRTKIDCQQQGMLITGGTDPATELEVSMGQEVACISTLNMEKIPADVCSVDSGKGVECSVLDAATSLHSPGDGGSDSPRSNGAQRITSEEATFVPMAHELNGDESQYYRGLFSSAKLDKQRRASILMVNGGEGIDVGLAIIDSGAAVHVTGNISLFCHLGAEPPGTKLYAANGEEMLSYGSGSICLPTLELKDVLYVPCVNKTIVSVSKLNELGYSVNFHGAGCSVRDERTWTRKLVGKARNCNGQYEVDYLNIPLNRTPVSEGPLISLWRAAWSGWNSLTKSLIQRNSVLASQRPSV